MRAASPHHVLKQHRLGLHKPVRAAETAFTGFGGLRLLQSWLRAASPHRIEAALALALEKQHVQPARAVEGQSYFQNCGLAALVGFKRPGLLQSNAGVQLGAGQGFLGCFKAVHPASWHQLWSFNSSKRHLQPTPAPQGVWVCSKACRSCFQASSTKRFTGPMLVRAGSPHGLRGPRLLPFRFSHTLQ